MASSKLKKQTASSKLKKKTASSHLFSSTQLLFLIGFIFPKKNS